MKKQKQNLTFRKTVLVELSSNQLEIIQGGGTTFTCGQCVLIPTLIKK